MLPKTHYARGPEGHIAYQVFGEGPRGIVFVPDHPTNIEIMKLVVPAFLKQQLPAAPQMPS